MASRNCFAYAALMTLVLLKPVLMSLTWWPIVLANALTNLLAESIDARFFPSSTVAMTLIVPLSVSSLRICKETCKWRADINAGTHNLPEWRGHQTLMLPTSRCGMGV